MLDIRAWTADDTDPLSRSVLAASSHIWESAAKSASG
jgi:hypothetical protein